MRRGPSDARGGEGERWRNRVAPFPSTIGFADGPPSRSGEEFGGAAARLAGLAGVLFGWPPETFWAATPAELAALAAALRGEEAEAADGALLARMMREMPDG